MNPQGPRSPAPCSRAPALGQHSHPSRFGAKATALSPAKWKVVALTSPQPASAPPGSALGCRGVRVEEMRLGSDLPRGELRQGAMKLVHQRPFTPPPP